MFNFVSFGILISEEWFISAKDVKVRVVHGLMQTGNTMLVVLSAKFAPFGPPVSGQKLPRRLRWPNTG